MLIYLFDLFFVLLVLAVACFVARRWSMVHCAAAFISVLIASLFAITTFEPIALWIDATYLSIAEYDIAKYLYILVFTTAFLVSLASLLWFIHTILPDAPEVSPWGEMFGRWGFGALTGCFLASFLLCVVMTFPAPRDFWGLFEPDAHHRPGPVMACAPDYLYLAFVEYTCDHTFALTGPWLLDRPLIPPVSYSGRWGSFPIRYAKWRRQFGGAAPP